ncbi:MAG: hypothetical protein GWP14_00515 [Actinobacteria bacterium]|nr:hypothetical protein [Actinomycetota bacterium]
MDYDISQILRKWKHKSGEVTVRCIAGRDGRPKIQMRLDLGLLQMEQDGRPDGRRPHGCESLLEYYLGRLDRYKMINGVEIGFELSKEQCETLREESVMYYYRYLSLFIMGRYHQVVRDTNHNLAVFDLCRKCASRKVDRFALEKYRPYVLMMNTRAQAQLDIDRGNSADALQTCQMGIESIADFFKQMSRPELAENSSELAILQALREDIQRKIPPDPAKVLHADLAKAIAGEQYEKAAELRDRLRHLNGPNSPSAQN